MNAIFLLLLFVCRMLSEEEAKERMEDADENNDGKVTWDEYVSDAYGLEGSDEIGYIQDENAQVSLNIG